MTRRKFKVSFDGETLFKEELVVLDLLESGKSGK